MKTTTTDEDDLLRAAMLGYQQQLREINGKMEEIRQKLRGPEVHAVNLFDSAEPKPARRKRRKMSAEGIERIRQAQIARWKKVHAATKKSKALAAA